MNTNIEKPREKKVPLHLKLMVSAAAGAFGVTCIFPIDTIKTRLQASAVGKYLNPVDCLQKILRNEGFYSLYKGLSANLIGAIPEKAIKLSANEVLREYLERSDGSISLQNEIIAGAGAGFFQVIATNPMEITKIRMQMQALLPIEQRQTLGQIVSQLGIRGMYTGTAATLTRDIPFSVLFFPGYANLKLFLADERGENSILSLLASGCIAGAIAAGAVTPSDVIKTRLQMAGGKEKYKSMGNAFNIILKEEGITALYKGAVPRMGVIGILFGITLLSFEMQKKYMKKQGWL